MPKTQYDVRGIKGPPIPVSGEEIGQQFVVLNLLTEQGNIALKMADFTAAELRDKLDGMSLGPAGGSPVTKL